MTQQRRAREKVSRKLDGRIYVAHFNKPIGPDGDPRKQAGHYLGWTPRTAEQRLADHKAGRGARLTQVANGLGIDYHIVQDWPGNRDIENQLKLRAPKRLCPECNLDGKTPAIIERALRREARSKAYYRRKEAAREKMKQLMAKPLTAAEKQRSGGEAASRFVQGQMNNGKDARDIEELIEGQHYGEGDDRSDYRTGWDRQLNDDLALAREVEREDELAREQMELARESRGEEQAETAPAAPEPAPAWLPTQADLEAHPAAEHDTEREAG
jgi:hypothetical protein